MTTYFNLKTSDGRETVDELERKDFPTYKEFIAEVRRLAGEYHMAGMAVYTSSRMCANWKD